MVVANDLNHGSNLPVRKTSRALPRQLLLESFAERSRYLDGTAVGEANKPFEMRCS